MNTPELFKIGDKCRWHKPEIDNRLYEILETKQISTYGVWRQQVKVYDMNINTYHKDWYNSDLFTKLGEENMATKKTCNVCVCGAEQPEITVNHVEITRKALYDALLAAHDDSQDQPEDIIDDCYGNYPDVEILVELLDQFGYKATVKPLGFEIILDKKA